MRPSIRLAILSLLSLISFSALTQSLKHHLVLTDDHRYQVSVSSFGYNLAGRLEVIVKNLTLDPDFSEETPDKPQYGFVIVKSDQARNPYAARPVQQSYRSVCLLQDPRNQFNFDLMTLGLLPNQKQVLIRCSGNTASFPDIRSKSPMSRDDNSHGGFKHVYSYGATQSDRLTADKSVENGILVDKERNNAIYSAGLFHSCNKTEKLPLEVYEDPSTSRLSYSFNFSMFIQEEDQEGTYYLSFHNCRGSRGPGAHYEPMNRERDMRTPTRFNLNMLIYETNYPENYLSAGAMPLPQMYFMLSVMFFLVGCVWVNYISRQKENILKIHNLMTVLVFAKACSLLFHGINYHYIALGGQPVVTWAYLYYATRSVKGALFFITLALIGTGWTFIKHILSPRDKKIILIIVALQIVAHLAEIVLDESTEGEASIEFWAELCGLVDLFSCIAILISITWSVRHLEEASSTDGKAAMNLKKMELFKRFYVISTVYIYLTRIMTFIFLSLLAFKYSWLAELFSEFATLVYFVITGCYFQPMPTNPYLLLSTDNDLDEDVLFSVDAHEMNGSKFERAIGSDEQDRNEFFEGEGARKTRTTRRVVEDLV